MASILETIASKSGASNSDWVDEVVSAIQTNAASIADPTFKEIVIDATQTLAANKDNIARLGVYGLTLFLQKIAIGDREGAYISYIETQATFQELISGEESDAQAIINATQAREKAKAQAEALALAIAEDSARVLIPFLLTLLI